MQIKYRGEELTPAERQEIANNFHISKHAAERLRDRSKVPSEVIDSQFEKFTNLMKELETYHNPNVTVRFVSTDFKIK